MPEDAPGLGADVPQLFLGPLPFDLVVLPGGDVGDDAGGVPAVGAGGLDVNVLEEPPLLAAVPGETELLAVGTSTPR